MAKPNSHLSSLTSELKIFKWNRKYWMAFNENMRQTATATHSAFYPHSHTKYITFKKCSNLMLQARGSGGCRGRRRVLNRYCHWFMFFFLSPWKFHTEFAYLLHAWKIGMEIILSLFDKCWLSDRRVDCLVHKLSINNTSKACFYFERSI